jgi:phytoene synthase
VTTRKAYAEVGRITRREARNFAWGIALLPGPKRRAVTALYAFARAVDDLADSANPAREELERVRRDVEALPTSDGTAVLSVRAPRRSGWPCNRSTSCETSPRTGG